MSPSVFILGTGFIGGSVLQGLLDEKKYEIAALCRDDRKADKLKELGVRPVRGELSSDEVISTEAAKADIIFHIATADDLPSVKSILKGLEQRPAEKKPAIYIHTSGTGVLTVPVHPDTLVFADKSPEIFDKNIPDHAPHREIDLTIKKAVESGKLNAKISIILPPCIYGIGTGPFNKRSIQIPLWAQDAVKKGKFVSYGPQHRWNNIHIKNLVTAYQTLLAHNESADTVPLYVIAETGTHLWGDIAPVLEGELKKHQLIPSDAQTEVVKEGNTETETGTQSISKSEWLHEWGWKVQKEESIVESVPETIQHMVDLGEFKQK
ncbi:hypothetical protein JCM10213_006879 [Rhodosporidiobolus nylandii]